MKKGVHVLEIVVLCILNFSHNVLYCSRENVLGKVPQHKSSYYGCSNCLIDKNLSKSVDWVQEEPLTSKFGGLTLLDAYDHGAAIKSVALSAEEENSSIFVAAGGSSAYINKYDSASLCVYRIDSEQKKLVPIFYDLPTECVYCCDWCTINDVPYLAVAGLPDRLGDSLWIYRYDKSVQTMIKVQASNVFNETIYSVLWISDKSGAGVEAQNLAVGGQAGNGLEVQLLQFNSTSNAITLLGSGQFGTTVFSMDWCKGTNPYTNETGIYVAVGGATSCEGGKCVNVRIYSVSEQGQLVQEGTGFLKGGTVRALKWRCQNDKICAYPMCLAIGGDQVKNKMFPISNIFVCQYNPRFGLLKFVGDYIHPQKVSSLEWLPCGEGDCVLAVGTASEGQDCCCNMCVYQMTQALVPTSNLLSKKQFNDKINSIKWYTVDNELFVLVGSESAPSEIPEDQDPLSHIVKPGRELVLFKGVFSCNAQINGPVPLSQRTDSQDQKESIGF